MASRKSEKPKRKRKPKAKAMNVVFPKEAFEPCIRDMVIEDMHMENLELDEKRKPQDYIR